jgi:hypothetical protein
LITDDEKVDDIARCDIVRDSKNPEQIPLDQISDEVRRSYMIKKIKYRVGRRSFTMVLGNVRTAVLLGYWMDHTFGALIRDIASRFITGDPTLIPDAIKQVNQETGKINKFTKATNPEKD